MRILWVKANKILPVHSGGELRSFNILRQLAKREEVIFFSYYEEPTDTEYEKKLREQLPGAIAVSTGKGQASLVSRGCDYLWRLPESIPYAVSRFASGKVRERLKKCLDERRPDVVVADFLDAAVNLPGLIDVPSVLFQHNVESEIWRRHATNESIGPKKLIYGLEFSKMLRYEQRAVNRFDHVIAVSDQRQEPDERMDGFGTNHRRADRRGYRTVLPGFDLTPGKAARSSLSVRWTGSRMWMRPSTSVQKSGRWFSQRFRTHDFVSSDEIPTAG